MTKRRLHPSLPFSLQTSPKEKGRKAGVDKVTSVLIAAFSTHPPRDSYTYPLLTRGRVLYRLGVPERRHLVPGHGYMPLTKRQRGDQSSGIRRSSPPRTIHDGSCYRNHFGHISVASVLGRVVEFNVRLDADSGRPFNGISDISYCCIYFSLRGMYYFLFWLILRPKPVRQNGHQPQRRAPNPPRPQYHPNHRLHKTSYKRRRHRQTPSNLPPYGPHRPPNCLKWNRCAPKVRNHPGVAEIHGGRDIRCREEFIVRVEVRREGDAERRADGVGADERLVEGPPKPLEGVLVPRGFEQVRTHGTTGRCCFFRCFLR
mmetsp:Transcript_22132/g.47555  ORF Transcript_22132/g.47555 Transcript_22132/m.47555 type:complete len:315 (+) Transcript_22132:682-1626(+)